VFSDLALGSPEIVCCTLAICSVLLIHHLPIFLADTGTSAGGPVNTVMSMLANGNLLIRANPSIHERIMYH